jgi:hypothetical protein
MSLGEINMYTAAGNAIISIVQQDSDIQKVLDIGSYTGLGTTLCIVTGAITRPDYSPVSIISLETNAEHLEMSQKNWKNRPGKEMVQFCRARVAKSMMTDAEIRAHPVFDQWKIHYDRWHDSDIANFIQAPLIEINSKIDLVIIDGGEYCGFQDYMAIKGCNPKYLMLDDINTMKTDRVLQDALQSGYSLIYRTEDRNGFAILKRST